MVVPPGFESVRERRTASIVRADLRTWLLPLLRTAVQGWPGCETQPLAGGRGGTTLVRADRHAAVFRPFRRGGLAARLLHDTYIGRRPRPFRELATMAALQRCGAPVVEVYGACVQWLLPACYKGWIATGYVSGAQTLWQWAAAGRTDAEREVVFRAVGRALCRLHRCGGRHPDLNLNNILVCPPAERPAVLFIDFDRPRLAHPFRRAPAADLIRLTRSARKLDPDGLCVTAADLAALRAAYRQEAGA